MRKLEIKLKQHTPLIHFQHDQDGATLRASEVKPKLDKFILTRLGQGNYQAGIVQAQSNGWLIGKGDHPALDYKMSINANGEPREYLIASLFSPQKIINNNRVVQERDLPFTVIRESPFFAQENINSDNKLDKRPVFLKEKSDGENVFVFQEDNWDSIGKKGITCGDISLTIVSSHEKLVDKIDPLLADFFICTNFGTRGNKGFGSFTIIDDENTVLKSLTNNYQFVYSKSVDEKNYSINEVFRIIKDDYQKIKAGKNHNGYTKSILFCYAVNKMNEEKQKEGPRWEKRFYKKAVKGKLGYYKDLFDKGKAPIRHGNGDSHWDDAFNYDYRYIRMMLGFAEQFEFLLKYLQRDGNWAKYPDKEKLIVKNKIDGVERFNSPIIFKVINKTIYVVGNDIQKELLEKILNKVVNLNYTIGNRSVRVDGQYHLIRTPNAFILSDFMAYAMAEQFHLGYKKIK